MAPPSLVEMCTRVAIDNIHRMNGFGAMPSSLASEILRAVKSAQQLHELELGSTDIYDETPQHWRRIIAHDFPKLSQQYQYVPQNPKSWFKVWQKYKRIQEKEIADATAILAEKLAAVQKEKDSKRTQVVTLSQAKRLDLPKLGAGVIRSSSGFGSGGSGSGGSHWSAQPRPKAKPLSKVKSQVKAEAKRLKLATPTGRLPVAPGQITKAPDSFVRDKRVERQFDFDAPSTTIRAPRRPLVDAAQRARDKERKEKEARLLRIKGAPKPSENVISFDDDDEDENVPKAGNRGALDDLFGELEAGATSSPSPPSTSTTKPRRRGLLTAAPGSTTISTTVTRTVGSRPSASPPKTTSPPATPPLSRPAVPRPALPRPEASSNSAPLATSPQAMRAAPKRKEVDIFMRPKKRVRR